MTTDSQTPPTPRTQTEYARSGEAFASGSGIGLAGGLGQAGDIAKGLGGLFNKG
jgi:hypothetical protein